MTNALLAILLSTTIALSASVIALDYRSDGSPYTARELTEEEARAMRDALNQGELDGKAIACVLQGSRTADEWLRENPSWFEFKDGRVTWHRISVEGTTAVIKKYQPKDSHYHTTIKTVRWRRFTLNRETLALKYEYTYQSATTRDDYDCELVDSLEAMRKGIEAAMLQTQKKIDEEMKDNKI